MFLKAILNLFVFSFWPSAPILDLCFCPVSRGTLSKCWDGPLFVCLRRLKESSVLHPYTIILSFLRFFIMKYCHLHGRDAFVMKIFHLVTTRSAENKQLIRRSKYYILEVMFRSKRNKCSAHTKRISNGKKMWLYLLLIWLQLFSTTINRRKGVKFGLKSHESTWKRIATSWGRV